MAYSGVHFRECPVEAREVWSQALKNHASYSILKSIIHEKTQDPDHIEAVVISTCNRFDILFFWKN